MRRAFWTKSFMLLFVVAAGGVGCIQIPVQISGLEGSFDPGFLGLILDEEFENEEIRIPVGSIDLSQLIEDAQTAGNIPSAVSIDMVLVDSIVLDADPGSSFDFVTDIEISFLPEGGTFGQRRILASASSVNGFGEQLELMTDGMFDILPFVTDSGNNNVGDVLIRFSGNSPDSEQTWLTTVNLIIVVGLGSG